MFCQDYDRLVHTFEKRGFIVHSAASAQEVKALILSLVTPGASVGLGGSMTLGALGVYEALTQTGHPVYDHAHSKEAEIYQKENAADWYIASTNAITRDGRLINIDGRGNRVAGMITGPREVILVIGKNKLAANEEEGRLRAQNVAAPRNAKRLNLKTPCVADGKCHDCASPDRICCVTSIIEYRPYWVNAFHLILVDEELGY
ncbi:MAG: lactate utilization protein [Candidatus Pelethousia sp.]|nr:lactate utilization protein [Candidatus Pelethousia sp.]